MAGTLIPIQHLGNIRIRTHCFVISIPVIDVKTHFNDKMKNKIYHTVGTVPKSKRQIVERGKSDILNTQIH